jgi:hypothetical protein
VVTPALLVTPAAAETPKCKTKANKHVACTDKLRAGTQTKKSQFDALPNIQGIKGESDARGGQRLRGK